MHGIKKLKSGRWQGRYFAGYDPKGKRIYPSKSFLKQADAIKWRNGKIHDKETGRPSEVSDLTVEAYMKQYREKKAQRMRPNSQQAFDEYLRRYILPILGSVKLIALRPAMIEHWQSELLKTLAPSTVRNARNQLSSALDKAVRFTLIPGNPVKQTDGPKVRRVEMKTFARDQAIAFLDECPDDKWGLFYTVALKTGIRPEEGEGLLWSALDLLPGREGRLRVERVLMTRGVVGWQFHPPKTPRSKRSIALPASLTNRLLEHRRRQLEERMAVGAAYSNNDFVFANPLGEPLGRTQLQRRFKAILKATELADMRLYDLRHSFVTLSLLAGVDVKTVSSDAGHASVAFTLDTYGHVLESMRESAASKREEMFSKSSAVGLK
ncbi:MAG: integrase [Blastocatellia bacterium]|nr:integrase [Blastocatellia bacterium]